MALFMSVLSIADVIEGWLHKQSAKRIKKFSGARTFSTN